jgi:hypothetical protein
VLVLVLDLLKVAGERRRKDEDEDEHEHEHEHEDDWGGDRVALFKSSNRTRYRARARSFAGGW